MEEWLLFSSNTTPAPSPIADSISLPLRLCVSFCRETACSHELKINHMTERGQLYRSCITYGSVCFFFHFSWGKKEPQSPSRYCVGVGSQAKKKKSSQHERSPSCRLICSVSAVCRCALCWDRFPARLWPFCVPFAFPPHQVTLTSSHSPEASKLGWLLSLNCPLV